MATVETSQPDSRLSLSSAGRATVDLALRLGGLFVAIIVVAIVLFILKPNAFNPDFGLTILRFMCSLAIMALGLTLVIVVGEIDLSFGAVYGIAANSLAVMWIVGDVSIWLAIPLSILIGALVGVFNGVLVTALKIPSFIVTLGTYNLLWGFSLWITRTSPHNAEYPPAGAVVPPNEYDFFVGLTQNIGPFSLEILWMIGLAIAVGLLLHRSLFGFRLMAIGGNPVAAKLARLPVTRYKILAFVLCGVLASLAGILDFSFSHSVQPDAGINKTFLVFAAVIIGGASLSGGKGTIVGTMAGALLLAELNQVLGVLSPGPHWQLILLGSVTIGAVALDLALTKLRERRAA